MPQDSFAVFASFLNATAWNYSVFLRSYRTTFKASHSSGEVIRSALGVAARLGGIFDVTAQEALAEIKDSLSYAGDCAAGPDPEAIQSARFTELLATVLAEVSSTASKAIQIEQFWLEEGHPAYPVFWDFAFLFKTEHEAVVLIGSSSD